MTMTATAAVAAPPASIALVTTADTDLLTAEGALADMPWGDAVSVYAVNPAALAGDGDDAATARAGLLRAVAGAGVVILRLLGGKRGPGRRL